MLGIPGAGLNPRSVLYCRISPSSTLANTSMYTERQASPGFSQPIKPPHIRHRTEIPLAGIESCERTSLACLYLASYVSDLHRLLAGKGNLRRPMWSRVSYKVDVHEDLL